MARHIFVACVVCLLCAHHLPCQHENLTNANYDSSPLPFERIHELPEILEYHEDNLEIDLKEDNQKSFYSNEIPFKINDKILIDNNNSNINNYSKPITDKLKQLKKKDLQRSKRHTAGHSHEHHHDNDDDDEHEHNIMEHVPELTKKFVEKIYGKFSKNGHMTLTDFENLLKTLGLTEFLNDQSNSNNNNNNNVTKDSSDSRNCVSNKKLISKMFSNYKNSDINFNESMIGNSSLGDDINNTNSNYELDEKSIYSLCPILLYQLTTGNGGCMNESELITFEKSMELSESTEVVKDTHLVWLFSFLSVFACGLLGLVGVAIIPFMNSIYYRDIIQFLVALAIGTMTGDALLHLLPHAILGNTEEEMVYKGLVCVSGIILFYAFEHGLTMVSEWRRNVAKKSNKKQKNSKKIHVERDPDSVVSINQSSNGDTVCKNKYNSSPHCFDEFSMDSSSNKCNQKHEQQLNNHNSNHNHRNHHHHHHHHHGIDESNETAQSLLKKSIPDSNTVSTNLDDGAMGDHPIDYVSKEKQPVQIILREHDHMHHGHAHKHGHVHSPPESLSAVAWMIILGDGLHNFTDGMAIGAAFSENIAGGFSTSLAVFFHELPHELGDFAILIKAGMSAKSAVYYNLLTGILSFIGMIFGILFGSTPEASQWMFAGAAGLFIYIALVDMMPEMTSAHNTVQQTLLQIIGLVAGLIIMLIIARYEHDLMNIFY